ncbi:family 78 glycoside hydrolase catalytic domain [Halomontanus rarus]|uniref:family 78 glycoside hydrolase catalytic domain n=1 Tax=Halomontanus rarus TaxID=3034020 RepID=UPI0023E76050|nr:family 78 glycoside hydrolase catalytic domain [Halovivax sp. TS33]
MAIQQPTDLRTEYASNPLGIDEPAPDLRWRIETDRPGARQTAFRVLVASSEARLADGDADVWDTGKCESERPAVTYDGPALESGTDYYWNVRVWDGEAESEWSEPAMWGMGLDADDWEASWIRRADEADGEFERGQFSYVRREFSLKGESEDDGAEVEGEIERARAYVAACHQYELSVNGERVDRGQSFSYPDYHYYKTVDVTGALKAGENAVGALFTWNGEGQGRPTAEPGFICQLHVELADGTERTIVTDERWQLREAEWDEDAPIRNGEIADPVEIIDGREVPFGWDEPGFDDAGWEPAAVVGVHPTDPWERLITQEREVVGSRVEPESVTELESGSLVFDFGRVYSGLPVVDFENGTEGHRVDMLAGYLLREDGTVDDEEGTQWTDMRYGYVQREGACTFRPFNYLGVRYLQIDDPGEDLDLEDVSLWALRNEVPDEHAATFESDEETVDAVFELARHSVLYGSQEQFIDTPTREKGQFLMDAFNISRATNRAFGERTLTRQAVAEFVRSHYRYWEDEGRLNAVYPNGDGKRDIPDFTEAFAEWVWRYYRTSGDRRALEIAYPVVQAIADYVDQNVDADTGLVTNLSGGEGGPYHEGIVDWPPEMRYGYDRDWPARTTVNILGTSAFGRAADIAAELDRPDDEIEGYRERQADLEAAIDEHLFVDGRYVDGCGAEDASEHASQHANAFALAFGLVPDEAVDDIADYVADQGMRMGPMMVPWLCEALETTDRTEAFVELLTDAEADGWANILAQDGTFTWETWHCRSPELPDDHRKNRSESHAMGATVLVSIQRALLGVRFRDLEAAHVEIRPPANGLSSASGTVPTERGTVDVSWDRAADGTLSADVTVPWNTDATVSLPATDDHGSLAIDGEVVWTEDGAETGTTPAGVVGLERTETDRIDVVVESGSYRFVLE